MRIVPVSEILTPAGLAEPEFSALLPTQDNYSALLIQPQGDITADEHGVRHTDTVLAGRQFRDFFAKAVSSRASLAVAPEYSVPWETLMAALQGGTRPAKGALWALGCEGIKYSQLLAMRTDLAASVTFLFEEQQPDDTRFCDPLVYVFEANFSADNSRSTLVCLVQFKTCAFGDKEHFEVNGMQKGTQIYQLGHRSGIRLTSLLCSDSFAFEDADALVVYDRALVLHLQLNPKPRQDQYRLSRNKLFYSADGATQLICLNWAAGVTERSGGKVKPWKNIAGSAWYIHSQDVNSDDSHLCANHTKGLYYTWSSSLRSHSLFFNYAPTVYLLTATKVFHLGVAGSLSRRTGPHLNESYDWHLASNSWVPRTVNQDGFLAIVPECGDAAAGIGAIAKTNPITAERLLALSAGQIESPSWHAPKNLDSCNVEASEIIRRITFCQDDAPEAADFRTRRLRRCAHLARLIERDGTLPASLADLRPGAVFNWSPDFPHQNIASSGGRRATVIYLGEEVTEAGVDRVSRRVADFVGRAFARPNEVLEAHQRLHVWYRDGAGNTVAYDFSDYLRYDKPRTESPLDFTRSA